MMMAVLAKWIEIAGQPSLLRRLAKAVRRAACGVIDTVDGGARVRRRAREHAEQRQYWRENARTQSQANAEAVRFDDRVVSGLEEMIAARIGSPVRHVASEPVLRSGNGVRTHVERRGYTKHRFEVSGGLDRKLHSLMDADGLLNVFVKSSSKLGLCAPLEFILSEQGGKGFRAPYFFGSITHGDICIGAWECVETTRRQFASYSPVEQRRIVEAIAAANAVRADGTVPVTTRLSKRDSRWFHSKYRHLEGAAFGQWTKLYGRTSDIMKHQDWLMRKLEPTGPTFLTHNDLRVGGNIFVPADGDVVLFDWEVASLSAPGADLGALTLVDSGDQLLSCYLSSMAAHGFSLDPEAVRFTLEVREGLRALHGGWRHLSAAEVERGLALLARHVR
jgi:hypothetical protein